MGVMRVGPRAEADVETGYDYVGAEMWEAAQAAPDCFYCMKETQRDERLVYWMGAPPYMRDYLTWHVVLHPHCAVIWANHLIKDAVEAVPLVITQTAGGQEHGAELAGHARTAL